jgi:hypothetical protein
MSPLRTLHAACQVHSSRHTCCAHETHFSVCLKVAMAVSAVVATHTHQAPVQGPCCHTTLAVSASPSLKECQRMPQQLSTPALRFVAYISLSKNITQANLYAVRAWVHSLQSHMWQSGAIRHDTTNNVDPSRRRKQYQKCSTQRKLQASQNWSADATPPVALHDHASVEDVHASRQSRCFCNGGRVPAHPISTLWCIKLSHHRQCVSAAFQPHCSLPCIAPAQQYVIMPAPNTPRERHTKAVHSTIPLVQTQSQTTKAPTVETG